MNKSLKALLFGGAISALLSTAALGQQVVKPCVETTSSATGVPITSCQPVSAANPLPTTGGGGGGGSVTQGTVPWVVSGQGTAGAAATGVVTIQGIAAMTPVLAQLVAGTAVFGHVIVDSGTLTAVTAITNALPAGTNLLGKVGVDQTTPGTTNGIAVVGVNAATALAGAGATGAGSLRVTAAQDTTTIAGSAPGTAGSASANVVTVQGVASMTKLLVTPDSVALPANQSVNVAQINGVTPLMGNGTTGTGSPRVTLSSDNSAVAGLGAVATGAAPPANAIYLGANASGATGGHVAGMISCDSHVFKHITTATDTLAVQGVASQTIRICGWRSRAAGVATWFLENTASANANCSSANTQITGVATEAANTGETMLAPFWTGLANTSGNGLCINSTGTGGVDVDIWYTQF